MLSRTDNTIQSAIDDRLKTAGATARRMQPVRTPRTGGSPTLFLVKPGVPVTAAGERGRQYAGAGAISTNLVPRVGTRSRVIVMPAKPFAVEHGVVVNALALLGPAVWMGHALLVWLKLI